MGRFIIPEYRKLRREARELLIKARVYRFFALAFAFFGFVIFLFLYFRHIDGRLLDALTNMKTVMIILVPFLPAAVLAWLSSRTEKKFYDIVHSPAPPPDGASAKKKEG